ncbi:MAG: YqgE/AlgH family protein [Desulfobacterales bacterium]|nr:YqgE/AlgH family protein [Desulfobacterales bacterium]
MEIFESSSLKGQFLISMPGLADPNFYQTVICMCDHNHEGALGIVINRVHPSLFASDIFEELGMNCVPGAASMPIHLGGPVHMNEIFMLHGPPFDWDRSLMITPQLAMSNTRDVLEAAAMGKGPESLMISLGCAGWGPGQLEAEIKGNAWLTGPIIEEIIFDVSFETRWEEAVRRMGIDPSLLSDKAGHA